LYVGSRGGGVHVFATATWRTVRSWQAHEHYVHAIRFSPDSRTLYTCSEDRLVRHWHRDGNAIAERRLSDPVTDLAVLSDSANPLADTVMAISRQSQLLQARGLELVPGADAGNEFYQSVATYPDGRGLILAAGKSFDVFDWSRWVPLPPFATGKGAPN